MITPASDDIACLWPPNHRYVCFTTDDVSPTVSDNRKSPAFLPGLLPG